MYRILVINPGSTSTKVALYADEERVWQENIEHPAAQISRFAKIYDQLDMRYEVVMDLLEKKACPPASLSAVVARGGLLPPCPPGPIWSTRT